MVSVLILDGEAPPQRSPQPLRHEPFEEFVHVQHERRRLRISDGVLQSQVLQHEPGQPQRRPVVLVESGEHDAVVIGGTVPDVAHVFEGHEVLHEPPPVDRLHPGDAQRARHGGFHVRVLDQVRGEIGEPAGGRDDDAGPSELAFYVYATPHGDQPVATFAIGVVEPAGQRGFCRTGEERDQGRQQVAGGLIAGRLVAPVAFPQPHFEQQEEVPQRDLGPHEHLQPGDVGRPHVVARGDLPVSRRLARLDRQVLPAAGTIQCAGLLSGQRQNLAAVLAQRQRPGQSLLALTFGQLPSGRAFLLRRLRPLAHSLWLSHQVNCRSHRSRRPLVNYSGTGSVASPSVGVSPTFSAVVSTAAGSDGSLGGTPGNGPMSFSG